MENLDPLLESLRRAVLEGTGDSTPELRQETAAACAALAETGERPAVASGDGQPTAALDAWVDKVARHAYQTLDRDVDALREEGWSDDAIFELTVAAAYGSARGRYDRARAAIEEAWGA